MGIANLDEQLRQNVRFWNPKAPNDGDSASVDQQLRRNVSNVMDQNVKVRVVFSSPFQKWWAVVF